ncbi:MAG: galactokinase [Thermoguttaceae bacterium]|nr:galactokinase [Thermoguttaceae bacterium]
MVITKQSMTEAFTKIYGTNPTFVARAPGRVNLIGEHTDYNDGFVMPLAIDRAAWIALRPRTDGMVNIHSLDYQASESFSLNEPLSKKNVQWVEYIKGVAWVLQQEGYPLVGWDGVLCGDVPQGAGLSSSAALEVVTARAFAAASDFRWDAVKMAIVGQKAENKWIGVNCGIMDQMISATGKKDHAVMMDCRVVMTDHAADALTTVPLPPGTSVIVLDTATRRGLVDSKYNERRSQCEAAARFFGVKALRDVDLGRFNAECGGLDEVTRRRAKHVVYENTRVLAAAEAMRRGDVVSLGMQMVESHKSLRDDYEVSSEALNLMVDLSLEQTDCFGARMTGAGFGGCAMALVDAGAALEFAKIVAEEYQKRTNLTPAVYVCRATDGAMLL